MRLYRTRSTGDHATVGLFSANVHSLRILVLPQAHEYRSPQLESSLRGFVGPLSEFDLGHEFRLHPVDVVRIHRAVERIAFRLQLLEQLRDLLKFLLIESCAGLAHVDQLLFWS